LSLNDLFITNPLHQNAVNLSSYTGRAALYP
jgi:hypothetical protein